MCPQAAFEISNCFSPISHQKNGLRGGGKGLPETLKYAESQNSKQQRINKHQHVTNV